MKNAAGRCLTGTQIDSGLWLFERWTSSSASGRERSTFEGAEKHSYSCDPTFDQRKGNVRFRGNRPRPPRSDMEAHSRPAAFGAGCKLTASGVQNSDSGHSTRSHRFPYQALPRRPVRLFGTGAFGPDLPFVGLSYAALQLSVSCHSCRARHVDLSVTAIRTFPDIEIAGQGAGSGALRHTARAERAQSEDPGRHSAGRRIISISTGPRPACMHLSTTRSFGRAERFSRPGHRP
jgi:hypothetical protein